MKLNKIGVILSLCVITVYVNASVLPNNRASVNCAKCDTENVADKCYTAVGGFVDPLTEIDADCQNECFTSRVGSKITRGCLVGTTDCTDVNTCIKCTGEMCNIDPLPEVKECIDCDSSTVPNCAKADKLDTVAGSQCAITVTQCFSEVDVNGITKRGCGAGSEINKLPCGTNKCNTAVFPTTRQTCHQCNNIETDCDNEQTVAKYTMACLTFKENDKCYSLYTADGKSRRGCASDSDYPSTCATDVNCKQCDGKNCNKEVIEPPPAKCIVCNSENEPKCANIKDIFTLSNDCPPASNCFVEINADGDTVRGCGDGTAPNKISCTGDNCNTAVFPTTRQICHQCKNTETDCINPLTDDKYALACRKYKDDDKCYSLYTADGKSRRGCASDSDYPSTCATDVNCKQCDGKNCNKEVIEPPPAKCIVCNSENEPKCANIKDIFTLSNDCPPASNCFVEINADGDTVRGCGDGTAPNKISCTGDNCNTAVFPTTRQICHQCKNTETDCINPLTDDKYALACRKYKDDDKCYSLYTADGKSRRGCASDSDYPSTCATDVNCKQCDGKNCNKEVIEPPPAKCIVCNSENEPKCANIKDIFTLSNDCPPASNCFVEINADGDTVRGCGDGTAPNKISCTGDNCNTAVFPTTRQTCHQCKSTEADCVNPLTDDKYALICNKYKDNDKCYSLYMADGKSRRGCASDSGYPSTCETDFNCKQCDGENCNKEVIEAPGNIKCIVCNSLRDPGCETRTNLEHFSTDCSPNYDCFVEIDENKHTVRGCGTGSAINKFTCSKDNCNINLHPDNRLECLQCSPSDEGCNTPVNIETKACKLYYSADKCYSSMKDKKFTRGCIFDENQACTNNICKQCNQKGCNTHPMESKPVLNCISCDETKKECEWAYEETDSTRCTSLVPFGTPEQCFINSDNNKVNRGCLLDEPEKCTDDTKCDKCTTNGCNKKNISVNKCIICDSSEENQKSCSEKADGFTAEVCPNQIYANIGCFTFTNKDDVVTRGCVSGLTEEQKTDCDNNEKHCTLCVGEGCNNENPNSSVRLHIMSLSILLGIYTSIKIIF